MKKQYPKADEIIYLLGVGALLGAAILIPGAGSAFLKINKRVQYTKSQKEWDRFNLRNLRRNLKRLQERDVIRISEHNNFELTEKGAEEFFRLKLRKNFINNKKWDGRWRVVLYDILAVDKNKQQSLRNILKLANFLKLQRSVYLTPYNIEDQIEELKNYFGLSKEVILITAQKIEFEEAYKKYFGI